MEKLKLQVGASEGELLLGLLIVEILIAIRNSFGDLIDLKGLHAF